MMNLFGHLPRVGLQNRCMAIVIIFRLEDTHISCIGVLHFLIPLDGLLRIQIKGGKQRISATMMFKRSVKSSFWFQSSLGRVGKSLDTITCFDNLRNIYTSRPSVVTALTADITFSDESVWAGP